MTDFISLDDSNIIGVGLHRKCYVHPSDNKLCVKIGYNSNPKEDKRELKYYKHLQNRSITWEMLPKFHGTQDTNLGPGTVFDLIRDESGSVSKTLEHYLEQDSCDVTKEQLCEALVNLKNYLLSQSILTMTLNSKNIVYKEKSDGSGLLIIVDNIGCSDFIPLCQVSSFFAHKKIMRKWNKFSKDLQKCGLTLQSAQP